MKKVILLASLLGAALLTNAQVSFGPFVGVGIQGPRTYTISDNSSTSTSYQVVDPNGRVVSQGSDGGDDFDDFDDFGGSGSGIAIVPKPGLSYKVGVTAKIDINKYLAISPGIAFQNLTSKIDILGSSIKTSTNYIAVPILVQGQFPINEKINVGLGVGPEFNILLGGKTTKSFSGQSTTTKIKGKGTITEADDKVNNDTDNANNVSYQKALNISLLVAPFIQFKFGGTSLLISPTYYLGLTNILSPAKYTTTDSKVTTSGSDSFKYTTTTTTTRNVDKKDVSKTGGFGLNVVLLFGGGK